LINEVEVVSGADFVLGGIAVTDVALGLEVGAVAGALAASFAAGYAAGSWLNDTLGISDRIVEAIS